MQGYVCFPEQEAVSFGCLEGGGTQWGQSETVGTGLNDGGREPRFRLAGVVEPLKDSDEMLGGLTWQHRAEWRLS